MRVNTTVDREQVRQGLVAATRAQVSAAALVGVDPLGFFTAATQNLAEGRFQNVAASPEHLAATAVLEAGRAAGARLTIFWEHVCRFTPDPAERDHAWQQVSAAAHADLGPADWPVLAEVLAAAREDSQRPFQAWKALRTAAQATPAPTAVPTPAPAA